MKKAPKKLSTAMRLALNDLAKVAKDKRYVIDMKSWHTPYLHDRKCRVCFAGAVMAKTCGFNPERDFYLFESIDKGWDRIFDALDSISVGRVHVALYEMGRNIDKIYDNNPDFIDNPSVIPYQVDPKQWRKDMWKIVKKLEKMRE